MTETKAVEVLHEFETDLYVDLTRDEIRERGESLAQTLEEIRLEKESLKDVTKQQKQKISLLEERTFRLGNATRFHRELRQVPVEVVYVGDGVVNEVRRDTGEVIRTRKTSEKEQQMTVPSVAGGKRTAKGS